jgi:hypothetical protein
MIRIKVILLLGILLAGCIIGAMNYKSSKKPFRILLLLLFLTLVEESLAEYCAHVYSTNLIVYHFFIIIEYSLFALIFYYILENKYFKYFILSTLIVFAPLSILNSIYIQRFSDDEVNSTAILTESILLVLYGLQFLYELLKKPVYDKIYIIPEIWFVLGIIFFYSTNIFFWGFYRNIIADSRYYPLFYQILFYENLILYGMCAISLWMTNIYNPKS